MNALFAAQTSWSEVVILLTCAGLLTGLIMIALTHLSWDHSAD